MCLSVNLNSRFEIREIFSKQYNLISNKNEIFSISFRYKEKSILFIIYS